MFNFIKELFSEEYKAKITVTEEPELLMYDFDKAAIASVITTALSMQNDFLDQMKEPRPIGKMIDNDHGALLKNTYLLLLKDCAEQLIEEIELLEGDSTNQVKKL